MLFRSLQNGFCIDVNTLFHWVSTTFKSDTDIVRDKWSKIDNRKWVIFKGHQTDLSGTWQQTWMFLFQTSQDQLLHW